MTESLDERILSTKRKNRLAWYEKEIEKRCKAFTDILRELRDDPMKPYLATHDSLGKYLEERWNMTPRRQQQLMAAQTLRDTIATEAPDVASVVQNLKEGPIRELAKAPPEKRVEVLREAIKTPTGKLTGTVMKRAKARVIATEHNLPMHTTGETITQTVLHPTDILVDRLLEEEWPIPEDKEKSRAAIKRIVEAAFSAQSNRPPT